VAVIPVVSRQDGEGSVSTDVGIKWEIQIHIRRLAEGLPSDFSNWKDHDSSVKAVVTLVQDLSRPAL